MLNYASCNLTGFGKERKKKRLIMSTLVRQSRLKSLLLRPPSRATGQVQSAVVSSEADTVVKTEKSLCVATFSLRLVTHTCNKLL